MPKLSGYATGNRRIDGALTLVEFVRTASGQVWTRTRPVGKWTLEATQDVREPAYRGNVWCIHPRGIELKSGLVRLPKSAI